MGKGRLNRPSFPPVQPAPGPWSLDWSLVDRDGPFPWPDSRCRQYFLLAGFLAAMNEESLDTVFKLERSYNGKSAIHALDSASKPADDRWNYLIKSRELDQRLENLDLVTMTYCLNAADSRRVIAVFDGPNRTLYPLWWDERHEVSGSSGKQKVHSPCSDENCYHLSEE